jgi:hypothetical protein
VRECILVIWCLKVATLCSVGWFERKLMVVSAVVGFQNMSISRLDAFWIISRSTKFIRPLPLYVGLSFMFVCIWFMHVLRRSGCVLLLLYVVYIACVEYYVFCVHKLLYTYVFKVL